MGKLHEKIGVLSFYISPGVNNLETYDEKIIKKCFR